MYLITYSCKKLKPQPWLVFKWATPRARRFMQLHILHCIFFSLQISLFAFFAKLLKFTSKLEKWSCKWCKSAVKHKFRLNFDFFFFENFLLKHNIRWQKWQTNFKIYQNLCIRVDFCTTCFSICRKTLFFRIKSASLHKISLFAVNDLLFYIFELHIFPSPSYTIWNPYTPVGDFLQIYYRGVWFSNGLLYTMYFGKFSLKSQHIDLIYWRGCIHFMLSVQWAIPCEIVTPCVENLWWIFHKGWWISYGVAQYM